MSDELNIQELVKAEESKTQPEQAPEETQEEEVETSEETSPEQTTPETEEVSEEPKVPLSRLRKEIEKRRELEKKLSTPESPVVQPVEQPIDNSVKEAEEWIEKRVADVLERRETQRIEEEKRQETMLDDVLTDIKDIDSNLNEEKFLKFYSEHNFEDNVDGMWDAYKIFSEMNKNKQEPLKPKIPSAIRTTDSVVSEQVDLKKDLSTIVDEAKRKFGLTV